MVYGFHGNGAIDRMEAALLSLPPQQAGELDVVIEMSGEGPLPLGRRVLTPLFDGMPGAIGVMAALANDQEFVIDLHDAARPSHPWTSGGAGNVSLYPAVSSGLCCAVA
jgi:hypothetical protein